MSLFAEFHLIQSFAPSNLNRDDTGRWTGTATKDGKAVGVSVKLPVKPAAPAAIN